MINLDYKTTIISAPYPIWIIDNILDESLAEEIKNQWLPNDAPQWNTTRSTVSGHDNILEKKMLNISERDNMPPLIAKMHDYLHSDDFTQWVQKLTGIDNLVTDTSARWSGMRVMTPGAYQLIHSDARQHPLNKMRKELTCLLYFNDDYNKERDEGCLEVWDDNMSERKYELEPLHNRLVIFLNSDTSYHGVPVVKKDRKAFTFSILKSAESSGRNYAEFVKRPEDPNIISELGMKRGMGK